MPDFAVPYAAPMPVKAKYHQLSVGLGGNTEPSDGSIENEFGKGGVVHTAKDHGRRDAALKGEYS